VAFNNQTMLRRSPPARAPGPERDERERPVVVLAVLVTVCVWSSAFIGIRSAGRQVGPGELALGRLLVGSLALGALMLVRREPLPPRRTLAGIVLCGVLWFGVYNVALNAAERQVDAGIAALLVNVGPIFIAILAGAVLGEGFPRLLLAGCVVSFSGAALIGIGSSKHAGGAGWGFALCIVAALGYAGGVVAQKPVLRHASPLAVTWLACTVGAVSCLPYAPSLAGQLNHARASAVVWIVYLGLVPTAIGFVLWAFALARTTAGRRVDHLSRAAAGAGARMGDAGGGAAAARHPRGNPLFGRRGAGALTAGRAAAGAASRPNIVSLVTDRLPTLSADRDGDGGDRAQSVLVVAALDAPDPMRTTLVPRLSGRMKVPVPQRAHEARLVREAHRHLAVLVDSEPGAPRRQRLGRRAITPPWTGPNCCRSSSRIATRPRRQPSRAPSSSSSRP